MLTMIHNLATSNNKWPHTKPLHNYTIRVQWTLSSVHVESNGMVGRDTCTQLIQLNKNIEAGICTKQQLTKYRS